MESEDLCNIVIQPGEYIRMKIDAKLNLSCDLSRNEIDPYNIIPKGLLFLENNRKIDELYNKLEKTVVTTLTNLQVKKNNTYTCRISKPSKFMEMKELIVGDKPSPVQNFACLLYDYEYWNCTFQANERVPTTYKVQYRISRLLYDCPCVEVNRGYECKTQLFRKTHPNYTFVVKSKNCFGEREEWFTIQASKNVIPADLELKVERANSTEAQLHWNIITMNEMLFEKGFVIKGKYRSQYDETWHNIAKFQTIRKSSTLTLKRLFGNTEYEVMLKVKANKSRSSPEMWRYANVKFHTLSEPPERSPEIDPGAFHIDNNDCAHVFWQDIPEYSRNGTGFTYILNASRRDTPGSGITRKWPEFSTNKYFYNEICGKGFYEFRIRSKNDEGLSTEASSIIVNIQPNRTQILPKPVQIKATYNDQVYKLRWKAPEFAEKLNLMSYTVFRCSSKAFSFELCESPIIFQRVPAHQTKIEFPNELGNSGTMIFAVSANYKEDSSGMATTLCIPHENTVLWQLDPKNDTVTSNTIKVEWVMMCEQRALVTGYLLQYCALDTGTNKCTGELINVTDISPDESMFTLTDLRPFTNYSLRLQMYSNRNRGPFSLPLTVQTAEAAPSAPRNLRVREIFSHNVILEWDVPELPNGLIKYYCVILNGTNFKELEAGTPKHTVSYNLTDLASFQTYSIQVAAATLSNSKKMKGLSSEKINIRTNVGEPGEVGSPSAENEDGTISVSWQQPREIHGPKNDILYELRWTKGKDWARTETNKTEYALELNCVGNQSFQIFLRAIQSTSCQNDNENLIACLNPNVRSQYNGKWLLVYDSYCYSAAFNWVVPVSAVLLGFALVAVCLAIFYKHKKMKTLKLIVPQGLNDIYESSPVKNAPKRSDSIEKKKNISGGLSFEIQTLLDDLAAHSDSNLKHHWLRDQKYLSKCNSAGQLTTNQLNQERPDMTILVTIDTNTRRATMMNAFKDDTKISSIRSNLSEYLELANRDKDLRRNDESDPPKTGAEKSSPYIVDNYVSRESSQDSKPEVRKSFDETQSDELCQDDESYEIHTIPNSGYVTVHLPPKFPSKTSRNTLRDTKANPEPTTRVNAFPVPKMSSECQPSESYEIERNMVSGYVTVHLPIRCSKPAPMPTSIGEARSNGVSTIPSNQEGTSKISNKYKTPMRDKPTEVAKNITLPETQFKGYVKLDDLSFLASQCRIDESKH